MLCYRYSKILYDLFAVHFTVQFICSGVVICVTSYQLSVVKLIQTPNLIHSLFFLYLGATIGYHQIHLSDHLLAEHDLSAIRSLLLWQHAGGTERAAER